MDRTCHHCNQPIEGDKPFCPSCGAPQIRVTVGGAEPGHSTPPPGTPMAQVIQGQHREANIVWSSALPRAGLAGFVSLFAVGLFSRISELLALLVVPLVTASFVVWLYRRSQGGVALTPGAGARIGLVTGFFSFIFNGIGTAAILTYNQAEFVRALRERINEEIARSGNVQQTKEFLEQFLTPSGLMILLLLSAVFMLFLLLVLGAAGGAMAASSRQKS